MAKDGPENNDGLGYYTHILGDLPYLVIYDIVVKRRFESRFFMREKKPFYNSMLVSRHERYSFRVGYISKKRRTYKIQLQRLFEL